MRNFGKSMLSLMKYNFNEMKKMVDEVNFDELEAELNDCKKSLVDSFNDLKSKVLKKNGKFVIEVPYDRDNQIMSFSVKEEDGNVFSVEVKPCDDCGDEIVKSTFSSTTTLPNGVLTERITQKYDNEHKRMSFVFETTDEFNDSDDEFEEIQEETEEVSTQSEEKSDSKKIEFEEAVEKMVEMHRNGDSFRKIAREFGISDKTVAKWIRKALN